MALEIEGIMKAFATIVAHVAPRWAVAFEVPSQHALQREGLGAEWAAKCPRALGSRGQCPLWGLPEGVAVSMASWVLSVFATLGTVCGVPMEKGG